MGSQGEKQSKLFIKNNLFGGFLLQHIKIYFPKTPGIQRKDLNLQPRFYFKEEHSTTKGVEL